MKRCILAALAVASWSGQLMAGDLKITFKTETKALLMTQKSEEVCCYSARYARKVNEKDKSDKLIDYRDLVSYEIIHSKKTIYIYKLDDMQKMAEMMKNKRETASPDDKKKIEKIFIGANDVVKAEQLGAETVAERACVKWNVTIGKKIKHAGSYDPALALPIPKADLDKGGMLGNDMMTVFDLMGASSKLQAELAKIKGFPLKTEWQLAAGPITVKIRQEATKIEEGPIPASVFELPKDYKTEDKGKEMLEKMNSPDKREKKK